ncbi:universal stress protein [Citricoccus sp. K5]|uniref:universal stress protein n=1 Tax=Citricoccus sp. K5 TaxID=2653135 RepID=UPI0012EF2C01|nr:universal stress protein [Citricoccus sp. K5]VXB30862.1 Nucleotide-binding universal stress UspA family protein [Citricoccus sp. K5]
MSVLVGRTGSPEGRAAVDFAVAEATRRGEDLILFDLDGGAGGSGALGPDAGPAPAGLAVTHRQPDARGRDAAGDLLDVAEELNASVIVVGIKHRSPVGKLLLGSNAQEILLGASVPVIAVKVPKGS